MPDWRHLAVATWTRILKWRAALMWSWLGRVPSQIQPDGTKLYTTFPVWCRQATDAELLEVIARPELEDRTAWGLWLIEHGYSWDGSDVWLDMYRELERRKQSAGVE